MQEPLFINNEVNLDSLPSVENISWNPFNRKYVPSSLLSTWLFGLLVPTVFLVINWTNNIIDESWIIAAILGVWITLFVFITVLTIIGFKYKSYAIREHDILYTSGWIFRKTTALPYNRIQHSEISQGPVSRMFGLSGLDVYTAGGSQSDLNIPGLPTEEAQRVKEFIMEKTTQYGN